MAQPAAARFSDRSIRGSIAAAWGALDYFRQLGGIFCTFDCRETVNEASRWRLVSSAILVGNRLQMARIVKRRRQIGALRPAPASAGASSTRRRMAC